MGVAELGAVGRNREVAQQRHREPEPDRGAVDHRDRRFLDPQHRLREMPATPVHAAIGVLAERTDVASRGERSPGASHDDRSSVGVGVGFGQRRVERGRHCRVERVEALGSVQRHDRYVILSMDENALLGHGRAPLVAADAAVPALIGEVPRCVRRRCCVGSRTYRPQCSPCGSGGTRRTTRGHRRCRPSHARRAQSRSGVVRAGSTTA